MNKFISIIAFALVSFVPSVLSDSLTAVKLEEVVTLSPGGAELRLKGSATKSNARQAIYVGGLYLENDAKSVKDIIDNLGAKRFVIKTNESVNSQSILRAINLGITVNHTEQELEILAPLVSQFNNIWKSQITQGDDVCIDFEPLKGTSISIDGVVKGTIPGNLFYKAFLKTWIGDRPLNADIKKQLIGKK